MKKILVVDDILTNRILLTKTLETLGDYVVVEASNGVEAIAQFEAESPDLILMDIMMPDVDGCQAATIIKEKTGDDYTPIIFVTALSAESSLARALASGGDDFISKPFNVEVLESKINAHLRIRDLNQLVKIKNKLLMRLNQRLSNEQELIEHFFENAIQQSFLDDKLIKYHMSSLSAFNGDIFLAERAPHGGLYLVMGDFTGHGLTAAMGTLPVAMVFFKMVAKSLSVDDIAREINAQLIKLMPPSMFFVATILELSARGDILTMWMGGMPDSYWLSTDGNLKGVISAQHMPLGILNDDEFDSTTQIFNIEKEDKLYFYSDGVIEAKNSEGELFGEDRLKNILLTSNNNRFDEVLNQLHIFAGKNNQNDDITLIELNCHAIPALKSGTENIFDKYALPWNITVTISADEMRSPDPVSKLSTILCAMPYVSRHKGVLHVLLSEIYSNSLDHSILQFHSEDKSDEEHFAEYYKKRKDLLLRLDDASIKFNFRFFVENDGHFLEMKIWDSGVGYKQVKEKSSDEVLYGRGLGIISGFSEKISFSDDGKTLEVLYRL